MCANYEIGRAGDYLAARASWPNLSVETQHLRSLRAVLCPDFPYQPALPAKRAYHLSGRTDSKVAPREKLGIGVGVGFGGEPVCPKERAVQWPAPLQSCAQVCFGRLPRTRSDCFISTHNATSMCRTVERVTTDVKAWDEAIHSWGPWWKQPRRRRAGRLQTPRIMVALGRRRRPLIERAKSEDAKEQQRTADGCSRLSLSSETAREYASFSKSISLVPGWSAVSRSSTWHKQIGPHQVSRRLAMPACPCRAKKAREKTKLD